MYILNYALYFWDRPIRLIPKIYKRNYEILKNLKYDKLN